MKPVELIERALLNSSKRGDCVVDLFGGSGSTLIACDRRKRHARLMEVDPKYMDVIVKRWQAIRANPPLSQLKAIPSGRSRRGASYELQNRCLSEPAPLPDDFTSSRMNERAIPESKSKQPKPEKPNCPRCGSHGVLGPEGEQPWRWCDCVYASERRDADPDFVQEANAQADELRDKFGKRPAA
jgi:hypothetical protein